MSGAPSAVSIRAEVAERSFHLDLDVPAGQVLAVLGPNGAGKSTLLGLVSGLVRPTRGTVEIGGRCVAAPSRWVPTHERRVSLIAQSPLLFPHLDVLDNVAFGPRAAGVARRVADRRAKDLLERFGCGSLARRRPMELSGGQAQRVALARALAPEPVVVLLDEPLSALDVEAAVSMRQLLREVLREAHRTAILVTHDLLDVLAVADRVVVLDEGRVVESGTTNEVLIRPRSPFAAALAGVNLILGRLSDDGSTVVAGAGAGAGAGAAAGAGAGAGAAARPLELLGLTDPTCSSGDAVAATFSPRAVAVHRDLPGGSPRNTVRVVVTGLERQGALVRVRGRTASGHDLAADITPVSVTTLGLAPGIEVFFAVKAAEVDVFPA